MTDIASILAALSDPTRRMIFERIAEGPLSVGTVAAGLPISRPAVSQHLKVLKGAGLVRDQSAGTRRLYHIDQAGLGAVRLWLNRFHVEAPAKPALDVPWDSAQWKETT